MAAGDTSDDRELEDQPLVAGDFSSWLTETQGALRGEHGSDVPCGSCTACCTSSQFNHIGPDETDTLVKANTFPRRQRRPRTASSPDDTIKMGDELSERLQEARDRLNENAANADAPAKPRVPKTPR